ncbi:MAG: type I methionyl aminopeptidase [Firmicutes bacterium HGW-Firmicutes-16]|nr:MAG: type I methionyl aminopeptidase [Firmicutes bacterium HGW-Firmicutes-16]
MSTIIIKSPREIELMRASGKITAAARSIGREMVTPGVTTQEIDKEIFKFIKKCGAAPSFLGYGGFPGSACISVNDEVIHGIPGKRLINEGDIVSIDVGAYIGGFHGDCCGTFAAGKTTEEAKRLIEVTRQSFFVGLKYAREGNRVSDISHAIQEYVESFGYTLVREYVGHGIGKNLHEAPEVPNFGEPGHGPRLVKGMTIAIEPMVNMGGAAVRVLDNDWTVVTVDGSLSAHYENTILITDGEPEILTMAEDL